MPPKISDRLAALKQKQDAIARQVSALQQKEKAEARKKDTRRKIIVGGLVLAYMEKDPAFADVVRGLIRQNVTRPHDIEAVAAIVPDLTHAVPDAAPANATATEGPQEEFKAAAAG